MKKLLLYLLLLPSLVFGQADKKKAYFMVGLASSTSFNVINDATFDFKVIQRTNAAWNLTATIPGVTLDFTSWEVREMGTDNLVGLSFDRVAAINTVTSPGWYYLVFKARSSTDQYYRRWDDIFNWYPKFTEAEADIVVDLSAGNYYNDFNGADNSGIKIYVKNSGTGYFSPSELRGSSGWANHARIQKETGNTKIIQTGVAANPGISFYDNRYVVLDAYNDDGTSGWEVQMPGTGTFDVRAADSYFTDIHIMGLTTDRTGYVDAAAFSFIPSTSITYNASTVVVDNFSIHDCTIIDAGAEGIYFAYTNDNLVNGYTPVKFRNAILSWNEIYNSGGDALQPCSAVNIRVHNNYIDTPGTNVSQSHENAISWNEGSYGLVYENFAINCKMAINAKSGLYPYDILAGQTTAQRTAFFGNIFIEGTPTVGGVTETVFNYIKNGGSNTAEWDFQVFNNTFVCNKLGMAYEFNAGGWRIPNLKNINNIFVKTGTAGDYSEIDFTGGGTFPSSPTVNNLVRSFSSYSDILFANGSGTTPADYRITSLTSPAFTGASTLTSYISGVELRDYQGLPLLGAAAYNHGAYGGYNLKTITPVIDDAAAATFSVAPAVGSLTDIGGTVSFEANKLGLFYYVVVANNATAPSVTQVRAGLNGSGAAALASGEILDPGTATTQSFTGLTESTAYDLYCVFVTRDEIEQAAATKVDFTTATDATAPTLSGWEITNAQRGRIYFNSSEVITATTYGGFTIAGVLNTTPTVTGITINTGATTGHYLTISENFEAIDYLATIAYSGSGSNLQDDAASPNALVSFTATSITNSITATRIQVNITSSANYMSTSGWNDADLAGTVGVKTLDSDLVDSNNAATGYALAITEAWNAADNTVSGGVGSYLSNSTINVRGIQVYGNAGGGSAGTLRVSGMTSGKTFDIVYGLKYAYGAGATGNVNINGAGGVNYSTSNYTEYKQSGTINGSGNIDIVVTNTHATLGIAMTGFILIIYP